MQTVVSREKDPFAFGVITVGAIQAGTAGNIIPDTAMIRGTIRSFEEITHQKLIEGIRRTAVASAAMAGAQQPKIAITTETARVVNDTELTERVNDALAHDFGNHRVDSPLIPASDDFGEFGNAGIAATYLFIGVYDPHALAAAQAAGQPLPANHSPLYAPAAKPTISTGVRALKAAVRAALTK